MKLSIICLAGIASAAEKKVPPRHPLQRLNRLVDFTSEILNSGAFNNKSDKWIENWGNKFANNAERMEKNFKRGNQRCGFYDENQLPHGGPSDDRKRRDVEFDRYDRVNPCKGMKQIITGFSKWADRYISSCSGQKNYQHQTKRMEKWGGIMNEGKKALECGTYTFVTPDTFHSAHSGISLKVSSECNADFADIDGDSCERYGNEGWCNAYLEWFVWYGATNENGVFETGLNCPQCGCGANGAANLNDVLADSANRKPFDGNLSKE